MTIDDLARQSQLPVRTIREYHAMRLLPAPERRGRVGIYGLRHVQRLELIARLQRRGYSLAGIRDLLAAWEAGSDLTSLLGVPGQAALDETPVRLTSPELTARLPGLSGKLLRRACAAGLVQPDADGFLVRSPALLALVADGNAAGLPLAEMLDLVGTLRSELTSLSDLLADHVVDRLVPAVAPRLDPDGIAALLQRGRLLLLQGVASVLADRLSAALLQRADGAEDGATIRAALERIRVGAVADSSGRIWNVAR